MPAELITGAAVDGLPEVRFWGDERSTALDASLSARIDQMIASGRADEFRKAKSVELDFLALSGGGGDGAYGAGLMVGWSQTGTRPDFEIVTGVSTGALMAPFVFLGPAYDEPLRKVYTTLGTSDVVSLNVLGGLLGGNSLGDSTPLARHIERLVDNRLLAAVAAEHDKGRRLFVATTNIDAQRPVVWDLGAIARAGKPGSLDLFRKVLLASASIPGVFPPVRIEVTAGGRRYEELHVDGGTISQVFFLPFDALLKDYAAHKLDRRRVMRRLYVVRNTKIAPEWQSVEDKTIPIVQRSLATLTKNQGVGDLYKLYLEARLQGMTFNYAAIPPDFTMTSREPFDTDYMKALFAEGYAAGRVGYPWQKLPPGMSKDVAAAP